MGAVGGALAGAALLRDAVSVSADSGGPVALPTATPGTVPAPTPGTSYRTYSVHEIRTATLAAPSLVDGYATVAAGKVVLPLGLPAGTIVTEVTIFANNATVNSYQATLFEQGILGATVDRVTMTIPGLTAVNQPVTVRTNFVVRPDCTYTLDVPTTSTSRGLMAARIGYTNVGTYVPLAPYRSFDTRPLIGRLAPNSRRTVDLGQEMNPSGVIVGTGRIPAETRAVEVNLTAVQATGANNFCVTSGDVLLPNQTALVLFNSATPTIANTGLLECFNRTINVHVGSGPGSAHCVIDVMGYYI